MSKLMLAWVMMLPLVASAKLVLPPPVIRPSDLRADEKPIAVTRTEKVLEENAFFQRVSVELVFSNANARVMGGELELPLPEESVVCGYKLEIKGEMVPGVVCEKEQARVAFENEVRKGVDPGIVEHVKGNLWKTRIFPLNPNVPRKAEVEYICERDERVGGGGQWSEEVDNGVYEVEDGWLYTAKRVEEGRDELIGFSKGTILWDASLSREGKTAKDRERLEKHLPEKGAWTLITYSNVPDAPQEFTEKAALLKALDAVIYDGATETEAARRIVQNGEKVVLFTDEVEEGNYTVNITRRKWSEVGAWGGPKPKEGRMLATVWTARHAKDLATCRKYGVAGPGMSLIVLETLEQWLEHKIEPPTNLTFHAEWVKRRAAEDDPIAAKREKADFEKRLLELWEERVKWWNDPKPKKVTPSSGLFDGQVVANEAPAERRAMRAMRAEPAPSDAEPMSSVVPDVVPESMVMAAAGAAPVAKMASGAAGSDVKPSVTLKPWDPKTPYVDALKAAAKGEAYATYLKERKTYRDSPAFYLDCAGWFFKQGETNVALRVISNLAEFKLEDAALWRTMGWRLREAGAYDESVKAFRHVLEMRGEEGQSYRDLALVLTERGKRNRDAKDLGEALKLLCEAAFQDHGRRAAWRSNDMQVSVFALEELNGLIAWCAANKAKVGEVKTPEFDAAYRRDLPVKLRIVMSWDADETDIDLHVLEPNGEEAYYSHRRTSEGGFVSGDVTTGYGPEEYLKKDLEPGVYKVLTNYFASHQAMLTGAATVTATVYTDWATEKEAMQVLTLRLDKPKEKCLIGEVKLGE